MKRAPLLYDDASRFHSTICSASCTQIVCIINDRLQGNTHYNHEGCTVGGASVVLNKSERFSSCFEVGLLLFFRESLSSRQVARIHTGLNGNVFIGPHVCPLTELVYFRTHDLFKPLKEC